MFLISKPLEIGRCRIENGYSITALGARSGLNPTTIFKLESGIKRVAPRTAKAVSDALGVSIYDLFELKSAGGDQA